MLSPPSVFRLGYVELATADLPTAVGYYVDMLGACVVAMQGDTTYLSLGVDHTNLALVEAAEPGLRAVGLQVDPARFEGLAALLSAQGIATVAAARPGISRLLRCAPVGGHVFELFAEMTMPAPGFAGRGIQPNKLGHVALLTPEPKALIDFLALLGFAVTDWFEEAVTFLTCNRDHHVINVVAAPVARLHHLAFELRSAAHQFAALDLLAASGRPTVWGPSRHTAGHNLASYHRGPDHVLVELFADMDVFVPELGCFEPRPWHDTLPQRPREWKLSDINTWGTHFDFDFRTA